MLGFITNLVKDLGRRSASLASNRQNNTSSKARYTGYSTIGGNPARSSAPRAVSSSPSTTPYVRNVGRPSTLPSAPTITAAPRMKNLPSRIPGKPETVSLGTSQSGSSPVFRDIPTFGASYYMPQDTLRLMDEILSKQPTYDSSQLRKRAEAQTDLLTNPQIETLREQINALKALIPETREGLEESYTEAQDQLRGSRDELYRALLEEAEISGGMRAGVAHALNRQLNQETSPLRKALETDYLNTRDQVMGALEDQKREAQNLLSSIQKNRRNMTEDNYNALKDQAVAQFREAQKAQQQFLQSIVDIEMGARTSAATFQQEAAAAENEFQAQQAQLLNQLYEQSLQQYQQEQFQRDLDNWINIVAGPGIKTKNQALGMLNRHRDSIISTVGQDGYDAIQKHIQDLRGDWSNPNYQIPESELHNYGSSALNSVSRRTPLTTGYSTIGGNPARNPNLSRIREILK